MLLKVLRDVVGAGDGKEKLAINNVLELDDVNCLVRGRHGWFLANRFDHYLGYALVRYGEYGELEHYFLQTLFSRGDCIIEVGANIGSHTVGLAKAVGTRGQVIAIEAQPAIFNVLCANIALNNLQNVALHQCGCGNGHATMMAPVIDYGSPSIHNSGGVSLSTGEEGIPVPVVPLDELAPAGKPVRLIKIDVEGMEEQVIRGAIRTIADHRPLLYVENDRLPKSKDLIECLWSMDYELWWHIPRLYNPDNYFKVPDNDYTTASFNMIGAPRASKAIDTACFDGLNKITDASHHPLSG
jgi:FkbM family methyltransferase